MDASRASLQKETALADDGLDQALLRRAFQVARCAAAAGDEPFGAVITLNRKIVAIAENVVVRTGDPTRHAEIEAIRTALRHVTKEDLAYATIYSSTEPCLMCAGAIYWSGLARLVFGCTQAAFRKTQAPDASWRIQDIWQRNSRRIQIVGPLLEREAMAVHDESCRCQDSEDDDTDSPPIKERVE